MTSITIKTNGASITATSDGKITSGMVGVPVKIEYDISWNGLIKTAFFRFGNQVRKRDAVGENTTVPWEILRNHGKPLEIGIEGRDADGNIVMPTVWATVAIVYQGASGEIPAAPNPDSGDLPPGGGSGVDGFSPIANVTQTNDGAVITITDKYGTTTATVTNGKDGEPGVVTADQIGLGNVDNTSDMDKPVSTAQAELFNSIGTSIDSLWDSYWNIISPTNIIKDSNADLDTLATTGDYTIAVNGIKNNPLTGIFENDMGKVYVRNDGYNRCMQFIHPLYGTSYGYAMPMRLYMRIGEIVSGVRKWGAWTEILTSNSGGWGIGKTIVNIGDSIFGNYDSQSITTYLAQFSGATVHNCGFGGTCAADTVHPGTPSQPFDFPNLANAICGVITVDGSTNPWKAQDDAMEQYSGWATYQKHLALIKSIDFSKVDVLTIAFGTNDWGIGTKTLAEIKAALKTGIELINKTYPKMKIVLICPIWRYLNGQSSDTLARGTDAKTLEDYSAEYESLAKELKVPFLDTYHNLTFNANNRDKFYVETGTESTHLNPDGRKMYAELIDGKLKTLF